MKPTLFIGSSREALGIAEAIFGLLESKDIEPTLWTQDVFRPNSSGLESLVGACKSHDYACFVLSRDDIVVTRGRRLSATRDNVILELGMFLGVLGRDRIFAVVESGNRDNLPSDLDGIFLLSYDAERARTNRKAALTTPCVEMADIIRRQALSTSSRPESPIARAQSSSFVVSPLDEGNSRWRNLSDRMDKCTQRDTACFISITGKNFLLPNFQEGEAVDSLLAPKALGRGVKLRGIILDPQGFEAEFRSRIESPRAHHENRLLVRDAREVAGLPAHYAESLGLGQKVWRNLRLKYSRVGLSFGLWLFSDIAFIEPFHFGKRAAVPHLCGFAQLAIRKGTEEFDLLEKHFAVLWENAEYVPWCT